MNIDRHNYETFFILYLDNELSSEQRLEVEAFAAGHPELQEELDMLLQTKFAPDAVVSFSNKEQLLKSETGDLSLANYEEWLLLYTDNELNEADRKKLEQFAAANAGVQKELALLQQTKLDATETIIFPAKESLYRKEETTSRKPVIVMRWTRLAIAAALLAAIATTAVVLVNKDTTNEQVANAETIDNIKKEATPGTKELPVTNEHIVAQENPEVKQPGLNDIPGTEKIAAITSDERNTKQAVKEKQPAQEEPVLAANTATVKDNGLPEPKNNPYYNNAITADKNLTASLTDATKESLTNNKEINPLQAVTQNASPSLNIIAAASIESADPEDATAQPGKKNKFRGFLRKVTRTFEKTTNIKATDDEDRLLVAGLAIKL